jgi:DNA-binding NtrC family response regulator
MRATILVVDDDAMVLDVCQRILNHGGHQVLRASGPFEALRLLDIRKTPIDLALIDVVMPKMNGVELAKRLVEGRPETRVILMSGYGPAEIARLIGSESPFRIIWKPVTADSLLRMIDNVLETTGRADAASGND